MNPLILFDYCYYKIANYYEDLYVLEHQKELAGVILLSLLQMINIDTLLMLFFPLRFVSIYNVIGYFILLTFNFIRYKKIITYLKLHERWKKEKLLLKPIKNTLVIIYIGLTFVLFIIALRPR
jgi:hypothetical protein